MNSATLEAFRREAKIGWGMIGGILLTLAGVLFLQSRTFNSSLWVLWIFAYDVWQEDLWQILRILIIWAGVTGVIFAVQFGSNPTNTDSQRLFTSLVSGFVTGFVFTYFLVFALGILIFIPLGFASLVIKDIVEYATLEFAWLTAAYIIFLWIALDSPIFLWDGILHGKWPLKLLAAGLMLVLGLQFLIVVSSLLKIIMESSRWITRWDAGLLMIFGSLIVTVIVSWRKLRLRPLRAMVFPVVGVYLASVATGNLSEIFFHWGELPAALVATLVAPILYVQIAWLIIHGGLSVVFAILGLFAGMLTGLFSAQHAKLAIIGQGWFGVLCGTSIAIGLGIGIGGMFAQGLVATLANTTRLKPEILRAIGVGFFFGVILGMVLGGFMAR